MTMTKMPVTKKKIAKNWIIWSPTSDKPSKALFTEKQARTVAEKLSQKNPNQPFFACKIMSEARTSNLAVFSWTRTNKVK